MIKVGSFCLCGWPKYEHEAMCDKCESLKYEVQMADVILVDDPAYLSLDRNPAQTKPTNPKDAVGIKKAPMSTVSGPVMMELGVAMMEGARKYGRHNYREAGVRGSVYYDAAMRHLVSWYEGEDKDPDSGLSHITKAIATLVVLRDAMIQNKMTDDRPPKSPEGFMNELNEAAAKIIAKYPNALAAITEADKNGL